MLSKFLNDALDKYKYWFLASSPYHYFSGVLAIATQAIQLCYHFLIIKTMIRTLSLLLLSCWVLSLSLAVPIWDRASLVCEDLSGKQ